MECEVFLAESRAAVQAGEVRRVTLDMPRFDIEKMRQSYYQEKKAMRQSFDQFLLQWENGWKDLPRPQAGLVRWSREELKQDFTPLFPAEEQTVRQAMEEQCETAWAAVWTIGPALETTSFAEVRNSTLKAMFLDVAGSLMMGSIRSALHEYTASLGLPVLGEFIPEQDRADNRLQIIASPWSDAPQKPDFTLRETGVLYPLKSQCAMFLTGPKQDDAAIHLNEIPCSRCKGSKCLYRQFGGCHLPIANNN